jgi:hypothetical protein
MNPRDRAIVRALRRDLAPVAYSREDGMNRLREWATRDACLARHAALKAGATAKETKEIVADVLGFAPKVQNTDRPAPKLPKARRQPAKTPEA